MDQEQLNEIRARHNLTTNGLWMASPLPSQSGPDLVLLKSQTEPLAAFRDLEQPTLQRYRNALFCAHAHQDIPDLLDEIARLRDQLASRWVSANTPPDKWENVLIHIEFNEPGAKPAIRLGYYDLHLHHWRTQNGPLKSHWQVTHWMTLPDSPVLVE